jgi:hypothetical protein
MGGPKAKAKIPRVQTLSRSGGRGSCYRSKWWETAVYDPLQLEQEVAEQVAHDEEPTVFARYDPPLFIPNADSSRSTSWEAHSGHGTSVLEEVTSSSNSQPHWLHRYS